MKEKALGWINVALGAVNISLFVYSGSIMSAVIGTWCLMIGAVYLVD